MPFDPVNNPTAILDAYLDGQMTPTEQVAFEDRLRGDSELRQAVARQQAIDRSLRVACSPPARAWAATVLARALADSPGSRAGGGNGQAPGRPSATEPRGPAGWRGAISRPVPPWAAVAALVVVVIGAGLAAWVQLGGRSTPSGGGTPYPTPSSAQGDMPTVYRATVAEGFRPGWVCRDEQEFRRTFAYRLGQELAMRPTPRGVAMVGLTYGKVLSDDTILVLCEARGQRIIVFVERAGTERPPPVAPEAGLRLFERTVGGLRLYELTPADHAIMLEYFDQPPPSSGCAPLMPTTPGSPPGPAASAMGTPGA